MLVAGMAAGDFYIICPDNDVTRDIRQPTHSLGRGRHYPEPPGAVALAPRLQGRIRRVPCLGVPVPALRSVDSVRLGTDDLHQWCPDHNAVIVALRTGTGMRRRRRGLSRQRWHVLRRSRRTVSNHRQDGDDTARSSRGARPSRICFLWGRYSPKWRRLNITNPGDHPPGVPSHQIFPIRRNP